MLKKLMKHDWIALSKKILAINIGLLAATILGIISFQTPLWTSNMPYLDLLAMLILLINIIAFIIAGAGVTIYLAVFFYKNLFTDEGYLMHTLPVKSSQLILSKLFTGFLAQILTIINIIVCVLLLIMGAIVGFDGFSELPEFFKAIGNIFSTIAKAMDMNLALFIIVLIVYAIVAALCSIMVIYGSLCIGQMFSKRRIMWSIVFYFVLYTIQQAVLTIGLATFAQPQIEKIDTYSYQLSGSVVTSPSVDLTELERMASEGILDMITQTLAFSALITALAAVGLFFLSKYMMDRKLNLE